MVSYYNHDNHHYSHESFVPAQEIVETDFSLLIGLSVATVVFLAVTLTSIKILRRKGTSNSMYTMTNINGKSSEYSTFNGVSIAYICNVYVLSVIES